MIRQYSDGEAIWRYQCLGCKVDLQKKLFVEVPFALHLMQLVSPEC